jgi:hypothetical protein
MTHELKIWPGNFEAIVSGMKKHEIRKADRDYRVGDTLILREFTPAIDEKGVALDEKGHTVGKWTGNAAMRTISYISKPGSFGLPLDLCVLSLSEQPRQG